MAIRDLLQIRGPRVFKYEWEGDTYNLTSKRLNDYVKIYLGDEFSAKDFRTWGGTLLGVDLPGGARGQGGISGVGNRAEAIGDRGDAACCGAPRKYTGRHS